MRFTGSKWEIIFTALPENDPKSRSPDISLAEAQVGWSPRTSLEDGLRDTVTYFRREPFQ
jgi:UDP-glucuronate decarboxylase